MPAELQVVATGLRSPVAKMAAPQPGSDMLAWVREALSSSSACLAGLTLHGPVWRSANSRIYRGISDRHPDWLAVKVCLEPVSGCPSEAAARQGHAALVAAADLRDGIAEPVALLPEHGILVTRWVEGVPLGRVAVQGPLQAGLAAGTQAGQWLARLHRSDSGRRQPLNVGPVLAQAEALYARSGRRTGLVDTALGLMRDAAPRVERMPVHWGRMHGDFKAANLIVKAGGVAGLDLEMLQDGPGLVDAAHFLNDLETLVGFPRLLRAHRRGRRIGQAFWTGYVDASGHQPPALALDFMRMADALRLLFRGGEASGGVRSAVSGLIARQLVSRLSRRLSFTAA